MLESVKVSTIVSPENGTVMVYIPGRLRQSL
jgi:hypothetical protein